MPETAGRLNISSIRRRHHGYRHRQKEMDMTLRTATVTRARLSGRSPWLPRRVRSGRPSPRPCPGCRPCWPLSRRPIPVGRQPADQFPSVPLARSRHQRLTLGGHSHDSRWRRAGPSPPPGTAGRFGASTRLVGEPQPHLCFGDTDQRLDLNAPVTGAAARASARLWSWVAASSQCRWPHGVVRWLEHPRRDEHHRLTVLRDGEFQNRARRSCRRAPPRSFAAR